MDTVLFLEKSAATADIVVDTNTAIPTYLFFDPLNLFFWIFLLVILTHERRSPPHAACHAEPT